MVCAIGGSSEMSQIHVQWSHFSRLLVTVDFDVSFNTKVWSVDHIIIVIYINGVCYRGVFRNVPNSRAVVTLFKAVGYCWLLLSLLLGVFRNVPNLGAVVRLFDSDWLLLI